MFFFATPFRINCKENCDSFTFMSGQFSIQFNPNQNRISVAPHSNHQREKEKSWKNKNCYRNKNTHTHTFAEVLPKTTVTLDTRIRLRLKCEWKFKKTEQRQMNCEWYTLQNATESCHQNHCHSKSCSSWRSIHPVLCVRFFLCFIPLEPFSSVCTIGTVWHMDCVLAKTRLDSKKRQSANLYCVQ